MDVKTFLKNDGFDAIRNCAGKVLEAVADAGAGADAARLTRARARRDATRTDRGVALETANLRDFANCRTMRTLLSFASPRSGSASCC
jgi:hypothetical protein